MCYYIWIMKRFKSYRLYIFKCEKNCNVSYKEKFYVYNRFAQVKLVFGRVDIGNNWNYSAKFLLLLTLWLVKGICCQNPTLMQWFNCCVHRVCNHCEFIYNASKIWKRMSFIFNFIFNIFLTKFVLFFVNIVFSRVIYSVHPFLVELFAFGLKISLTTSLEPNFFHWSIIFRIANF